MEEEMEERREGEGKGEGGEESGVPVYCFMAGLLHPPKGLQLSKEGSLSLGKDMGGEKWWKWKG